MNTTSNFPVKTTRYSFGAKVAITLFLILFVATFSFAVWTAIGGEV